MSLFRLRQICDSNKRQSGGCLRDDFRRVIYWRTMLNSKQVGNFRPWTNFAVCILTQISLGYCHQMWMGDDRCERRERAEMVAAWNTMRFPYSKAGREKKTDYCFIFNKFSFDLSLFSNLSQFHCITFEQKKINVWAASWIILNDGSGSMGRLSRRCERLGQHERSGLGQHERNELERRRSSKPLVHTLSARSAMGQHEHSEPGQRCTQQLERRDIGQLERRPSRVQRLSWRLGLRLRIFRLHERRLARRPICCDTESGSGRKWPMGNWKPSSQRAQRLEFRRLCTMARQRSLPERRTLDGHGQRRQLTPNKTTPPTWTFWFNFCFEEVCVESKLSSLDWMIHFGWNSFLYIPKRCNLNTLVAARTEVRALVRTFPSKSRPANNTMMTTRHAFTTSPGEYSYKVFLSHRWLPCTNSGRTYTSRSNDHEYYEKQEIQFDLCFH